MCHSCVWWMQSKACLAAIRADLTQTMKTIKKAQHGGVGAIYYTQSDCSIPIKKRAVEYKSVSARAVPRITRRRPLRLSVSTVALVCGQKKPNRAIHQAARRFAPSVRPAAFDLRARVRTHGPKTAGRNVSIIKWFEKASSLLNDSKLYGAQKTGRPSGPMWNIINGNNWILHSAAPLKVNSTSSTRDI